MPLVVNDVTAESAVTNAPDSRPRVIIHSLTGVRALAAVWVVIGHFNALLYAIVPGSNAFDPFLHSCYLGVDLFFVLSGFILTHTYLQEFTTHKPSFKRHVRFLWMRLARIYPVHIFCLLVLLVGVLVGSKVGFQMGIPARLTWWDFGQHLMLTHAWGFGRIDSWNGPAWSISAEWAAYLVFPVLCYLVVKVRSPRIAWVGVITCYILLWALFGENWPTFAPRLGDEADRPLVRILAQFIAGCFLYRVYQSGWGSQLRWSWVAGGCVLALFVYMFSQPPNFDLSLLPAPILAMLILALARSKTGLSALLATPFFIFWGEVSYALYMTHGVVQKVIYRVLPPDRFEHDPILNKLAVMSVYIVVVFGAGVLTYLLIERPARRVMRRWAGGKKSADLVQYRQPKNLADSVIPALPLS